MTAQEKFVSDEAYQRYLSALIKGDRAECARILAEENRENRPIIPLYEGLFQRSLYRVGELWEMNRISVATEHMATSITEGFMNQLYSRVISPHRRGKKVIVASAENEMHQVGAKMAADVFEMQGWDSLYLGANTPTFELVRFIDEVEPDLVGISLSVYFHMGDLEKMLNALRKRFPNLPVLIGGQAFCHGGGDVVNPYPDVIQVSSLGELKQFILKTDGMDPDSK